MHCNPHYHSERRVLRRAHRLRDHMVPAPLVQAHQGRIIPRLPPPRVQDSQGQDRRMRQGQFIRRSLNIFDHFL